MNGMRVVWERGPREVVMAREPGKAERPMLGKNGGPIIRQTVVKRFVPKAAAL